ncbi:MAG: response regulator [Myxococcales bacterium]|nr:response regulator [Myxococcales bacterium]
MEPQSTASAAARPDVLVVEDDFDVRDIISMILERAGMTVATAKNGRDALDQLGSAPLPRLILLDLMMPVMTGQEFLVEYRKDERLAQIPVVVVTAYADGLTDATGVAAIMCKPVDMRQLLGLVQQHCRP